MYIGSQQYFPVTMYMCIHVSLNVMDILTMHSVVSSKKTLLFQSEEGARLTEESRQLDMRMGHLKETHQ